MRRVKVNGISGERQLSRLAVSYWEGATLMSGQIHDSLKRFENLDETGRSMCWICGRLGFGAREDLLIRVLQRHGKPASTTCLARSRWSPGSAKPRRPADLHDRRPKTGPNLPIDRTGASARRLGRASARRFPLDENRKLRNGD